MTPIYSGRQRRHCHATSRDDVLRTRPILPVSEVDHVHNADLLGDGDDICRNSEASLELNPWFGGGDDAAE